MNGEPVTAPNGDSASAFNSDSADGFNGDSADAFNGDSADAFNGDSADASEAELAEEAWSRGQTALEGGDRAEATRWLDRALRLAPGDSTIALALASASIGSDNARAAVLFAQVAAASDVREAWFGLATARFLTGDLQGARAALAKALSRHTPHSGMAALADRVVREAYAPGWCGLTGDGVLIVAGIEPEQIDIAMDGVPVACGPLPRGWPRAQRITVIAKERAVDGGNPTGDESWEGGASERHLIGSPISPGAIGRVEGLVENHEDGPRGWAWHPGDPETDPVLTILAGESMHEIVAFAPAPGIAGQVPLARPRSFAIPWDALPAGTGHVRLVGRDGRDLLGSPIMKDIAPNARVENALRIAVPDRRDVSLLVRQDPRPGIAHACLESVIATVDPAVRLMLRVGPSQTCVVDLERYGGRIERMSGEIGPGMFACPGHDVVLLDGGAVVPPGWLERLRDAAYAASDIGTATPFSNRGAAAYPAAEGLELDSIECMPIRVIYRRGETQAIRGARQHRASDSQASDSEASNSQAAESSAADSWAMAKVLRLDRVARNANGAAAVDLPHGGGPCLFIRGDCLAQTGPLRSLFFAQGHGEQEDFCIRALRAGWRHVALTGLFIGCRDGARSAGGPLLGPSAAALAGLRARNAAVLERLHPGFAERVESFRTADPLAAARRNLDLALWAETFRRDKTSQAAIFVTHGDGGGVARRVEAAAASREAQGRRIVVLRPARMADGSVAVEATDGDSRRFRNLRFALPREKLALQRFLRRARPVEAQIHHVLNHDPAVSRIVQDLGVPYEVHVHDFAWFCPRIALVGRGGRYCGEPDAASCEACVAETGSYLHEDIAVPDLLRRSRDLLTGASRVVAPSQDAADRMEAHFPGLRVAVVPHEDDAEVDDPPAIPAATGTVRVCVAGAIGLHKGFYVLLACARDARERNLDLAFAVAGTTIDDRSLLDTQRVFVTGQYRPDEAVDLIRAQNAALGFLPSICPETWCLGLTELWRAGLRVAAFDIGAPAERIRRTGRGFLLPLGLSPASINDSLLNSANGRSFLPIRRPSAYKNSGRRNY